VKGFPVETTMLPRTVLERTQAANNEARLIVFCMGITCSGKSAFIDSCTREDERFGAIKVGEVMRARYSPERFRGLAAMPDTEDEVWEIFSDQLADSIHEGRSVILVDGQPRMPCQVDRCLGFVEEFGFYSLFLWFKVGEQELERRLHERFEGTIGALNLSKERMKNDKIQLYDTIQELFASKFFNASWHVPQIVKSNECRDWLKKLQNFISGYCQLRFLIHE
jgi:predicted kinase